MLRSLLAGADVLVDNFRPSLRAKLGFGTEALLRHNPRLVHVTITAFGDDGPAAEAPGFDPVIQACSGLMDACGDGDRPYYTSTPVHDVATGALALVGALAALHARARSGRGGRVALSLAGSSRLVQLEEMVAYEGRPAPAQGARNSVTGAAGRGYHRAADGWLAIAATAPPAHRARHDPSSVKPERTRPSTLSTRSETRSGAPPPGRPLEFARAVGGLHRDALFHRHTPPS